MNVKFDSNQSRAAKRQNCQKFLIASARLKLHLGFGESEINSPEKNELCSFESFLMLIRPVSLFQKSLRRGGAWCENGQRILKLKWTSFCQSDAQKYAVD